MLHRQSWQPHSCECRGAGTQNKPWPPFLSSDHSPTPPETPQAWWAAQGAEASSAGPETPTPAVRSCQILLWRNLPIPPSSSQSLKGQWGPRHTVNTRHRAWYSRLSSWNACQVWRYRRHTHVMVWIKSNLQLFPSKAAEINTVTLTHFILLSTFPNSRRIDAFKTWF